MTCLFSNLNFGETVHLYGGQAACPSCGADVQSLVETIGWIYNGHSKDIDLFSATSPIYCPTCRTHLSGYGQVCGEFGGLNVSKFLNPIIHEEAE